MKGSPLWYDDMSPEQQVAHDEWDVADLESEHWWIQYANYSYHKQKSHMPNKVYEPHTAPVSIIRETRKYGAR